MVAVYRLNPRPASKLDAENSAGYAPTHDRHQNPVCFTHTLSIYESHFGFLGSIIPRLSYVEMSL